MFGYGSPAPRSRLAAAGRHVFNVVNIIYLVETWQRHAEFLSRHDASGYDDRVPLPTTPRVGIRELDVGAGARTRGTP